VQFHFYTFIAFLWTLHIIIFFLQYDEIKMMEEVEILQLWMYENYTLQSIQFQILEHDSATSDELIKKQTRNLNDTLIFRGHVKGKYFGLKKK
jgi:hypothetical protein